jgi:hypothetical protein
MSKFLLNLLVQISKALVNSKILFSFRKDFFSFWPNRPSSQLAHSAFWPTRPHWPPSSPFTVLARLFRRPPFPSSAHFVRALLWRIPQTTFSSLIHAFHPRRILSLPSLMHGPHQSTLSPTPRRLTPTALPSNPAPSGLPTPPSSAPRVAAFVP